MPSTTADCEDELIRKARKNADKMLKRLIEIAETEPPSHASIRAAEVIIRLARERTSDERDPFNPIGAHWLK